MHNTRETAMNRPPDTLQFATKLIAGSALFWGLASTLLYFLAPGIETYRRLLTFGQCTGISIIAVVLILRRLPLLRSRPAWLDWSITGAVAIPTGFVGGHFVAFFLLGEPMRLIQPGRFAFVPLLFTVLASAFALYYFAMHDRLAKEGQIRAEAQRLAAESELRMLRAQLEPHMLFNTLANLRSLLTEDPRQAEIMIDRLIIYLRSALSASRSGSTTLAREFKQLHAYLEIMAIRMGTRLVYSLELPADLETTAIPPMLLQPLVENAIKHGIEPKVGPGTVEVFARQCDAGIEIIVSDSGLGLPPNYDLAGLAEVPGGSYGLVHVRDRLKSFYGPKASMQIKSRSPTGVLAIIIIPN